MAVKGRETQEEESLYKEKGFLGVTFFFTIGHHFSYLRGRLLFISTSDQLSMHLVPADLDEIAHTHNGSLVGVGG